MSVVIRCKRVDKRQLESMIEFLEHNPAMCRGIINYKFTKNDRRRCWTELAAILNEQSDIKSWGAKKSVDKWRKCWNDYKTEIRKKYSGINAVKTVPTTLEKRAMALIRMKEFNQFHNDVEEIPFELNSTHAETVKEENTSASEDSNLIAVKEKLSPSVDKYSVTPMDKIATVGNANPIGIVGKNSNSADTNSIVLIPIDTIKSSHLQKSTSIQSSKFTPTINNVVSSESEFTPTVTTVHSSHPQFRPTVTSQSLESLLKQGNIPHQSTSTISRTESTQSLFTPSITPLQQSLEYLIKQANFSQKNTSITEIESSQSQLAPSIPTLEYLLKQAIASQQSTPISSRIESPEPHLTPSIVALQSLKSLIRQASVSQQNSSITELESSQPQLAHRTRMDFQPSNTTLKSLENLLQQSNASQQNTSMSARIESPQPQLTPSIFTVESLEYLLKHANATQQNTQNSNTLESPQPSLTPPITALQSLEYLHKQANAHQQSTSTITGLESPQPQFTPSISTLHSLEYLLRSANVQHQNASNTTHSPTLRNTSNTDKCSSSKIMQCFTEVQEMTAVSLENIAKQLRKKNEIDELKLQCKQEMLQLEKEKMELERRKTSAFETLAKCFANKNNI